MRPATLAVGTRVSDATTRNRQLRTDPAAGVTVTQRKSLVLSLRKIFNLNDLRRGNVCSIDKDDFRGILGARHTVTSHFSSNHHHRGHSIPPMFCIVPVRDRLFYSPHVTELPRRRLK